MSYFEEGSKEALIKMQNETMESMGITGKDNILAAMKACDKAEEMERVRILDGLGEYVNSIEDRTNFNELKPLGVITIVLMEIEKMKHESSEVKK